MADFLLKVLGIAIWIVFIAGILGIFIHFFQLYKAVKRGDKEAEKSLFFWWLINH